MTFNLTISRRLMGGFAIIVFILVATVFFTVFKVSSIDKKTEDIVKLRTPTSQASEEMTSYIYASMASLRGWMLTGNSEFTQERIEVWNSIAKVEAQMDVLSTNWTNPENIKSWGEFKKILQEFSQAQDEVESLANTPAEQPAIQLMTLEAAPRAAVMSQMISNMIDVELARKNISNNHVQLLGIMDGLSNSLGHSIANIRGYLLTGDQSYVEKFNESWEKNNRKFNLLGKMTALMSSEQKNAFSLFTINRAKFSPLPAKMFEIRASDRWNMANYTMVQEAAPRANELLNMLIGSKLADGSRAGGMVANQKMLLNKDALAGSKMTKKLLHTLWALMFVSVALAIVISWITQRSIVPHIVEMTRVMKKLADGDLSTSVPSLRRRDEIGEMSSTVQVFKDNAIRNKELEAEQEALKRSAEEEKHTTMVELANEFDSKVGAIVNSVSSASSQMQSTAQSMSGIAENTSALSASVSSASEEASTNVQTVAAAAEQMSHSISEINNQVNQASNAARQAVTEVNKTSSQMESLSSTVASISEVVNLIADIAEQTNLLALNATIESARAGEAGKGFAVVASEVKELASQTGKATEGISAQVEEIQRATKEAVASMADIGNAIAQVDETSTAIATSMEQQGLATEEIARNVQEAASGTEEVTRNIVEVNQASQESGAAAGEVMTAASELSKQSALLKGEVEKFISQVRSA